MAGQQDRSFLESFGRVIGQLPMGIKSPLMEKTIELQLAKEKRQLDEQLARQQLAVDQLVELERQKELAADWQREYGNKPEADSLHGPIPEFNKADQLRLYQQYGQAGLDPEKVANTQQAELAADVFRRGLANVTNPAALVNIGMGKEYKPVELEGGVFYNPYDTKNFNLGSTQKHLAETQLVQSEAAEQALRLANIRALKDPLMQINATANKELGQPIESEVEGPDGNTHKALITQDSSGNYHYATVTDSLGKPLVIPPEAVGSNESPQMKLAKEMYGLKMFPSLEEAMAVAVYSKTDSPEAFFIDSYKANAKDSDGVSLDQKERLAKTMVEFASSYPNIPIPDIVGRINRTISDDEDKQELLTLASTLNSNLPAKALAKPVINATNQSLTDTTTGQGSSSAAVIDQLINQWQGGRQPASDFNLNMPSVTTPAVPTVTTQKPIQSAPAQQSMTPQQQPLTANVISEAWQMINSGEDPRMVRNGLIASGFDLSDEAIGRLSIEAVSAGVPADLFQKYLASIGLVPSG